MESFDEGERLYARAQRILGYHQSLLGDGVRNRLLYAALQKHVTPESTVLDIGCGTGVWAIMAAKLGARRVVAVEAEDFLIPIIAAHARENGVADRVEVRLGKSTELDLGEEFDVIISETIGNKGFDEGIVETFLDAKQRFLAPQGVLIPQQLALYCAPARIDFSVRDLPRDIPFSCEYLKSLAVNVARVYQDRDEIELLGEPRELICVDLMASNEAPSFERMAAQWPLAELTQVNAFALFARSRLTEGVVVDTYEANNWGVVACEFMPFSGPTDGALRFELTSTTRKFNWTVSLPSAPEIKPRSYAPAFTFMHLMTATGRAAGHQPDL